MGDDIVRGGKGSFDEITGGIGRDRIDGGPGSHDTASYRSAGGPIEVDLEGGRVSGAENERLVGIEEVIGGPGSECFGTAPAARSCGTNSLAISGGDGPDNIAIGLKGADVLVAGESGPLIQVGGGGVRSVLVSLGAGDDQIAIEHSLPPGIGVTIDGGTGSDWLRGGRGGDTIYAGDDGVPDRLQGRGGDDALFGVNILHPRHGSGAATMLGGGGNDLLIGGQPCEGDLFSGGPGANDSASFARVRNEGTFVRAKIGGAVGDPDVGGCVPGRIAAGTEKIEGSPGPDVLIGNGGANVLLGRGGSDLLDGRGGKDRCIGGRGSNRAPRCEYVRN
jgi:Ca2+-binding RTX toxin-like protein